jgi:hypothetical protein
MMQGQQNIKFPTKSNTIMYLFIYFLPFYFYMFLVNAPDIFSARLELGVLNYLTN